MARELYLKKLLKKKRRGSTRVVLGLRVISHVLRVLPLKCSPGPLSSQFPVSSLPTFLLVLGHVPQEAESEAEIRAQEVYWEWIKIFKGSRFEQGEGLSCNAVTKKASANPMNSSR